MSMIFDTNGNPVRVPGTSDVEWTFDLATYELKIARRACERNRRSANAAKRFAIATEVYAEATAALCAENSAIARAERIKVVQAYLAAKREKAARQLNLFAALG